MCARRNADVDDRRYHREPRREDAYDRGGKGYGYGGGYEGKGGYGKGYGGGRGGGGYGGPPQGYGGYGGYDGGMDYGKGYGGGGGMGYGKGGGGPGWGGKGGGWGGGGPPGKGGWDGGWDGGGWGGKGGWGGGYDDWGGGKGGGDFGRGGGKGGGRGGGPDYGAPQHDYRRMEGDTARIDVAKVNDLLSRRVGAKRARDFRAADAMRNELRGLGVAVLDREREWHVIVNDGLGRPDGGGSEPYGGYGGAHNMSERFGETGHDYTRADDGSVEVDEAKVNEMLAARLHARLNRDFVAADRMRDQLRREYGVEVIDQDRVWKVVASESAEGNGAADGNGAGGTGGRESRGEDERHTERRRRVSDDREEDEEEEGGDVEPMRGEANGEEAEAA